MATITTELIEQKRDERGRKITSKAERAALVAAYAQSGLTQKAFAKREGIKFCTFTSWLQRRRKVAPTIKSSCGVRFAEVTLSGQEESSGLEVQLADGTIVRGRSAAEVAKVAGILRSESRC